MKICQLMNSVQLLVGSITSRCSGKELALLPEPNDTRERPKSSLAACGSEDSFLE